ncbi:MAG: electron transfer flavoprotein subunit alpha/FixB family protein [Thaumarchaeota archaeon]|nr:electron transfer flavoprotein subunit alpha/FixB family protein [Nitrososphaerota archaeon]
MSQIISFSEDPELSLELAGGAAALAGRSGQKASTVIVDTPREPHPGQVILLTSDTPIGGNYELIAGALAGLVATKGPATFLIGATRLGRQVAAKLAVMLGMGVLSDVRDLRIEQEELTGVREAYAGRFKARVACVLPCIALVPPGGSEAEPGAPPSVEEVRVSGLRSRVKYLEVRPKSASSVDLKNAERIVAVGRGFKKKEDLILAEKLAKALGAVLGASRPLSSDLGWLGEEYHIGLTGIYVKPKLYVAIGISGQLQHVAGIKDSKVIVAINSDRQAPIFQVADYGIVGDLYVILPTLTRGLAP